MIALLQYLSWVKPAIKIIKKYNLHIVVPLVLLFIALMYFMSSRAYYIRKFKLAENNYIASIDTLRTYKDQNGMMTTEITAYSLSMKQLKSTKDSLFYLYTKELKNPKVIQKIGIKYIKDTINVTSTHDTTKIDDNGNVMLNFNYKNEEAHLSFNAKNKFNINYDNRIITNSELLISDFEIKLGIITGIDQRDGKNIIFVKSTNPYVVIDTIFGNILPDNGNLSPDRIGGPKFFEYFGIAVGPTVGYDFIHKNFSAGVGVTAGLILKRRR